MMVRFGKRGVAWCAVSEVPPRLLARGEGSHSWMRGQWQDLPRARTGSAFRVAAHPPRWRVLRPELGAAVSGSVRTGAAGAGRPTPMGHRGQLRLDDASAPQSGRHRDRSRHPGTYVSPWHRSTANAAPRRPTSRHRALRPDFLELHSLRARLPTEHAPESAPTPRGPCRFRPDRHPSQPLSDSPLSADNHNEFECLYDCYAVARWVDPTGSGLALTPLWRHPWCALSWVGSCQP